MSVDARASETRFGTMWCMCAKLFLAHVPPDLACRSCSSQRETFRKLHACARGERITVQEAHGADIADGVAVAALVEHAADLVDPGVADVACHPRLLLLLIILSPVQVRLVQPLAQAP